MAATSDSRGAGTTAGPHGRGRIPAWLPNAISLARIGMVPAWWAFAEACRAAVVGGESGEHYRLVAAILMGAMGVSDLLDGWLARRFGLASRMGATLDAVADKLAQLTLLTFFALRGFPAFLPVPFWFWAMIVVRDLIMVTGSVVVRRATGRVRVVHRVHGKLSSLVLFVLLFGINLDIAEAWALPAMIAIVGIVCLSTAYYFRDGWIQVRPGGGEA